MKSINFLKRSCLGFFFCIGMSLCGANIASANLVYAVKVKSSFLTEFDSCWSFGHHFPGVLKISDLNGGGVLTYAHDNRNKDDDDWQATSLSNANFGISFHGEVNNHGSEIKGNAVNEFGDTFVFKGKRIAKCQVPAVKSLNQTTNPWSR